MNKVLENLVVVEWSANIVHYESYGKAFYSQHLLADRIKDFGSDADDIKEKYYLGYLSSTPPRDVDIVTAAKETFERIGSNPNVLRIAYDSIVLLIVSVENAKKEEGLPAGVHAVLDDISSRALTYKFLVASQMAEEV